MAHAQQRGKRGKRGNHSFFFIVRSEVPKKPFDVKSSLPEQKNVPISGLKRGFRRLVSRIQCDEVKLFELVLALDPSTFRGTTTRQLYLCMRLSIMKGAKAIPNLESESLRKWYLSSLQPLGQKPPSHECAKLAYAFSKREAQSSVTEGRHENWFLWLPDSFV